MRWLISARSRIARCEVRYNREKVLLVESGYRIIRTDGSQSAVPSSFETTAWLGM
jgi:hypothetical protein